MLKQKCYSLIQVKIDTCLNKILYSVPHNPQDTCQKHFELSDTCYYRHVSIWTPIPNFLYPFKRANMDMNHKIFCTLWQVSIWTRVKQNFILCSTWINGHLIIKFVHTANRVRLGHVSRTIFTVRHFPFRHLSRECLYDVTPVKCTFLMYAPLKCDPLLENDFYSLTRVKGNFVRWDTYQRKHRTACHISLEFSEYDTCQHGHVSEKVFNRMTQGYSYMCKNRHVYHPFRTVWLVSNFDTCNISFPPYETC